MWNSIKKALNLFKGCKLYNQAVAPPLWTAPDLVPYCMRHTYATDLQDAGVPINIAKYLLGHEDIATTGNIYTHETDTAFEAARTLIDAYG
jgi:site-specific recombinase XerD